MDWWLFGFFLGAILSLFLPIVPVLFYVGLFLALAIILFKVRRQYLLSGLCFGVCWLLVHGYLYQNSLLLNGLSADKLFAKTISVQGQVSSLVANKHASIKFNFLVNQVEQHHLIMPLLLRLHWTEPQVPLAQGDTLTMQVKLKPAHGLANLGSFSYQTWLRAQHIVATGYVQSTHVVDHIRAASVRQQQHDRLNDLLADFPHRALILALALGERSAINPAQWQVLTHTGTQHLIAISGLHLGLVASISLLLGLAVIKFVPLEWLSRLLPSNAVQGVNGRYLVLCLCLLSTFAYANLAGFAIPTIRALLMLLLFCGARLVGLKFCLQRWLLLSVFLMLLLEPFMLLTASFWLSCYAVLAIFLLLWRFAPFLAEQRGWRRALCLYLLIQLGLSVLLTPVTAAAFQRISVVAVLANLLAVPWLSFVILPVILLATICSAFWQPLAKALFALADWMLALLWQLLEQMAQWPWASAHLSAPQIQLLMLLAVLSGAWFCFGPIVIHQLRTSVVWLMLSGLTLGFSLLAWHWPQQASNWQLIVFDVGNGSAMLLQKNQRALLYDVGAKFPSGFNIAEAVIVPYLQHQQISVLDYVLLSHSDNDHAGSFQQLNNHIAVNAVIANFAVARPELLSNCLAGQTLSWQGLTLEQLWPTELRGHKNDDSCVVRISDGKHSVLFTGDISKKVERQLLQTEQKMKANVLIVPHHGSNSSSSTEFISAVQPTWAIFSSGFMNQWHMPTKEVLMRYRQAGVQTLNTAETGMLTVKFSAQDVNIKTYRQQTWPYWFAN